MLTKAGLIYLGPHGTLAAEEGHIAWSPGNVNEDGALMARRQWGFTRALLVLVPLESEGGPGFHVQGGDGIAMGSANVTCQVCRIDVGNRTVILWERRVRRYALTA